MNSLLGQTPGARSGAQKRAQEAIQATQATQARQPIEASQEAQGALWRDCAEELAPPATGGVYLLALFFNGVHSPYRHAKHYLGWAANIRERLAAHRSGHGARFTQVVVAEGYDIQLVRIWPGASRTEERRLKRWHGGARLCPICGAAITGATGAPDAQREEA